MTDLPKLAGLQLLDTGIDFFAILEGEWKHGKLIAEWKKDTKEFEMRAKPRYVWMEGVDIEYCNEQAKLRAAKKVVEEEEEEEEAV